MHRIKRIRSVAHSFAQHALSGVSGGTPERSLEQRREGVSSIRVAIAGAVDPVDRNELQQKFAELLEREGIDPGAVVSAQADFSFLGQCRTASACCVTINVVDGSVVDSTVHEASRPGRPQAAG